MKKYYISYDIVRPVGGLLYGYKVFETEKLMISKFIDDIVYEQTKLGNHVTMVRVLCVIELSDEDYAEFV